MSQERPSRKASARESSNSIEAIQCKIRRLQLHLYHSPTNRKRFGAERFDELAELSRKAHTIALAWRESSRMPDASLIGEISTRLDSLLRRIVSLPGIFPTSRDTGIVLPVQVFRPSKRDPFYVAILKSLSCLCSRENREHIELMIRDLKVDVRTMRKDRRDAGFIRFVICCHVMSTIVAFAVDKLLRWSEKIRTWKDIAGRK